MTDGTRGSSGAASEPTVTVLDGRIPGARLLRLVRALDEAAGQALQRVAADVLAGVPPFVLVDLSVVDAGVPETRLRQRAIPSAHLPVACTAPPVDTPPSISTPPRGLRRRCL